MTSKRNGFRIATMATAASMGMLLSSCSGTSSTASSDAGGCNGNEVSVGITSSASDAPLYVAQDKGYFKDEGLSVKFVNFDSAADMVAPLGGGQLDVGAGAPSAGLYNAVSGGLDLRIVADKGSMPDNYGYMPLLVRKELYESGEITSVADLAGHKVAEPAEATATSSTLNTMLHSANMGYDDVQHEFIGFAEHPAAFQNGAIDAALTTEPSATVAEQQGSAVRLATPPEFYENQQLAVLLYSETFAADETEAAQCFMNAYLRGARVYVSAFEAGELSGKAGQEVSKMVTDATGLDPQLYEQITPNYVDPNGAVNVTSLQKDYRFFQQQGFLEASVEIGDIVDPSFARQATSELGKYNPRGS